MLSRMRPTPMTKLAAALSVCAALALAGCGTSAPSKSQYVAKADAVCARASAKTAPLIRQVTAAAAALATGGASAAVQLGKLLAELHGVANASVEELRKLKQPSGEHAAIERFVKPFSEVAGAIGKAAAALEKGQARQALELLEQIRPASEQATAGSRAYGLKQCETVLAALD